MGAKRGHPTSHGAPRRRARKEVQFTAPSVYSAHPLNRAIQHQLENPLAQRILADEFGPGDTIGVDTQGGRLDFPGVKARAA
jgi:ATP-dependent Clp protease ATP-binding subunit ClpA